VSINLVILSKKLGTVSHSVFVIDLIPDFISPSRTNESGFVFFMIFSISLVISATVLFFPVRKLIWVLYVRKKQKTQPSVSEEEKISLKKRATFTAILLCVVFSYIYVKQVFN